MTVDRVAARHLPPRHFKLSYLVTAWTQRPEDEHRLLSALLSCFLRHDAIPPDLITGPLAEMGLPVPMTIALPPPEDRSFADVWSALGGELKPSLDVVISAPTDTGQQYEAGPPVVKPGVISFGGLGAWPPREAREQNDRATMARVAAGPGGVTTARPAARGPAGADADRGGRSAGTGGRDGRSDGLPPPGRVADNRHVVAGIRGQQQSRPGGRGRPDRAATRTAGRRRRGETEIHQAAPSGRDHPEVTDASLGYLLRRVGLVEDRIRALVLHRRADDPAPDDPFRGLYVTEEVVDQLLAQSQDPPRADGPVRARPWKRRPTRDLGGCRHPVARAGRQRRADRPRRRVADDLPGP